jgi:hypothetical protein
MDIFGKIIGKGSSLPFSGKRVEGSLSGRPPKYNVHIL